MAAICEAVFGTYKKICEGQEMEEISGTKSHKLILNNRRTGSFTGILDVLSFDVGEILLETELGMLDLKGKDLHVNS